MVCRSCNSGVLSRLDRELASRSIFSLVVSHQLNTPPEYLWDSLPQYGNIAAEVRPNDSWTSLTHWPQMIVLEGKVYFVFDDDDILRLGGQGCIKHFDRCMRRAYHGRNEPKSKWRPEIISTPPANYPPRVFARRPVRQFRTGMSFLCRYRNEEDHKRVRRFLDKGEVSYAKSSREIVEGAGNPGISVESSGDLVMRSLVKIALNLIGLVCQKTDVGGKGFFLTRQLIYSGRPSVGRASLVGGFVPPNARSLLGIRQEAGCHVFRMSHDHRKGVWGVVGTYFGGQSASVIVLPGSSNEDWATCDVTFPIKSRSWAASPSALLLPPYTTDSREFRSLLAQATYEDIGVIAPTLPLANGVVRRLPE